MTFVSRCLTAAGLGWRLAVAGAAAQPATQRAESFADVIARLSEPGGHFDSDNLVSNEASFLHVMGGIDRLGVRGGAYVGVGPDQNFSYMARIRPEIAYLIDIRRDNLLLHLMFKALFIEAPSRIEYLCLLYGRPAPADPGRWTRAPLERLLAWIDSVPATDVAVTGTLTRTRGRVARFGVELSETEYRTMQRFHSEFIRHGLDIRFTSAGRGPRAYYPTHRDLLLERDRDGRQRSYLVSESDYRFLRELERRDRVVPVVGDLAGTQALPAIGRDIAARGLVLSAFYVSNVEFYLFGAGTFDRFAATVAGLPRDRRSVMIRSWFGRFTRPHPLSVPGYASTQVLQTIDAFLQGHAAGYQSYWDVTTHDPVPPS
jgi:hypothetical protein